MRSESTPSRRGLNYKGRATSLLGKYLGPKAIQPLLEKAQLLLLSGMNIGGATLAYSSSGETEVMRLIKNSYDAGTCLTVFDVGAHRGDYATLLLEILGDSTIVCCFEPSRKLFLQLEANLRRERAQLYNVGLGDENSEMSLFVTDDLIPTILGGSFEITGQTLVSEEKIQTVRLDDFCKDQKVNEIHFLKIDVEGFEMNVLTGAGEWVTEAGIDFIQFEVGPHSIASRTFMHDFFQMLGPSYRLYRILRNGLYELGPYSPRLEQFASATNYLAISKKKLEKI